MDPMLKNETFVEFTTGTKLEVYGKNLNEYEKSINCLFSQIAAEHFEEIIDEFHKTGQYNVESIEQEIKYLIDDQIIDHKKVLEWILLTLSLEKFGGLIEELDKEARGFDSSNQKNRR